MFTARTLNIEAVIFTETLANIYQSKKTSTIKNMVVRTPNIAFRNQHNLGANR
jgi:hypothetical protein